MCSRGKVTSQEVQISETAILGEAQDSHEEKTCRNTPSYSSHPNKGTKYLSEKAILGVQPSWTVM